MIARSTFGALILIGALVGACGGSPPDLGNVEPREPLLDMPTTWKLVMVEGIVPAPEPIRPLAVEVDPLAIRVDLAPPFDDG